METILGVLTYPVFLGVILGLRWGFAAIVNRNKPPEKRFRPSVVPYVITGTIAWATYMYMIK